MCIFELHLEKLRIIEDVNFNLVGCVKLIHTRSGQYHLAYLLLNCALYMVVSIVIGSIITSIYYEWLLQFQVIVQ